MAPMSFISELMSSSSSTATSSHTSDARSATTGNLGTAPALGPSLRMPLGTRTMHSSGDEIHGNESSDKENAKLISIRELVARNAAKDRPAIVVMDESGSTNNDNNSTGDGRQHLLSEMLGRKMGGNGSSTSSSSSSTSSSDPTTPNSSSFQRDLQSSGSSTARSALNELLLKRQPSQSTIETARTSPQATGRKKRTENPALQALLAQRSAHAVTSDATAAKPTGASSHESKNRAIAELLAKRVAPHPAPEPSGGDTRKNALAEMLAKRGGPAATAEKPKQPSSNALAEMLAKRHSPPSPTSSSHPTTLVAVDKENADPKANALAAMLARRAGGGGSTSTPTPTPAKRNNAIADMLAKRSANNSGNSEKSPVAANPLAEMLAKRQGGPAAPGLASAPGPGNALAEMMAKRQAAAPTIPSPAVASGAKPRDAAPPVDEHANTPLKDHPTYSSYFKMLKIGQAPEVVRHRMRREGVDASILDYDPTKPLPTKPLGDTGTVADDQDPEFVAALKKYNTKMPKYQQMLKMGLPRGAVVQKMLMEGVDPAWMDGPPQPTQKAIVPAGPTEAEIAAHREKYKQYFQMLKMGLPRGAVEHKMRMAGVDPKELDGPMVAGGAPPPPPHAGRVGLPPAPLVKKANAIRKKLHWEVKRQESRDTQRESLWNLAIDDDTSLTPIRMSQESKEMLEKLFVKETSKTKTAGNGGDDADTKTSGGSGGKQPKKQVMYLIDMKKSQNIAITLARVKLPFPELKREILALNPTVLSTAQLQSLMDMWPDQTEQVAIDNFHGDDSLIGAAEKFLVEVRNIPRFREKLGCLVFKQEFPTRVHELRESVNLVIRGVNQVCCSSALQQLFIYILQTGNLLNFGADDTRAVSVGGFSLNSLVKLSQTKAFTGGVTFLQYVVQSIARDLPQLGRFPQQINLIQKCSKVSISSLFAEKKSLEDGVKSLTHEAQAVVPAEGDADAELGASILKHFAAEVEREVNALQDMLDQLMECKSRFLEYFEEEETSEELDVLLAHIANFTSEFQREHAKHVEMLEKKRLQDQQKQDQEAKKKLQLQKPKVPAPRGGIAAVPRHSLHENPLHPHHNRLRSNQHGHGASHIGSSTKLRHTLGSRPDELECGEPETRHETETSASAAGAGANRGSRSGSGGQSYFPQFVVEQLKKKPSFGETSSGVHRPRRRSSSSGSNSNSNGGGRTKTPPNTTTTAA